MTFAIGHVQGGTDAGRKRPLLDAGTDWPCICLAPVDGGPRYPIRLQGGVVVERRVNPGYLVRCPDCGEKQPRPGRHRK